MDDQYLDFDEAVAFLKTNSSTLYKWLQSGKVPGHKLGRQWRFVRDELELHLSGKSGVSGSPEKTAFEKLLSQRSNDPKLILGDISQLVTALSWDAFSHTARAVHFVPQDGQYEILYRIQNKTEKLITIPAGLFYQLDQVLQDLSVPVHDVLSRRAYVSDIHDNAFQMHYQKTETYAGPRVTLQLHQASYTPPALETIVPDTAQRAVFTDWLARDRGIIIVSGGLGSGKTTTALSFLNHLKQRGKIVFSLEDSTGLIVDGINQIELRDESLSRFTQTCSTILASDPDVVAFFLSSYITLKQAVFEAAYRAASVGQLVLIHLHVPSCDAVFDMVKRFIPEALDENLMVGISSQSLIKSSEPDKRRAVYNVMDFKSATTQSLI